jgi:cytochrome P450
LSNSVKTDSSPLQALDPPGPSSPINIAFLRFRKDPLGFLQNLTNRYGDFATFKILNRQMLFANHPDYIRDVLVTQNSNFVKGRALQKAKRILGDGLLTSEGELHHAQRRLVLPAFHRQRIASYGSVMVEHATRTSDQWQDGMTVDISQEMTRLTLGIVAKTLFDADVGDEADEIGEAMTVMLEMFNLLMYPFAELLEKLPLPMVRRYEKMRFRLDSTIYRIIDERRKAGVDRQDLLSTLLLARDEDTGGKMTDLQVRDEAMTLFLAGHETTANALAWTFYLLSRNPAAETKLHAELDKVLESRRPTFEDVAKLQYTEMVVSESMRLYPPAWGIGRRSLVDQTIGPYRVPADSIILLSPFVTQRDSRFFAKPDLFKPERWTPEWKASLHPFAYFPFGGGSRRCIGEGFAWAEAILVLATLCQRWRARLDQSTAVEPHALFTLRPRNGIQMRLEQR